MDEIVHHQHLEECCCAQTSKNSILWMIVNLVMCDWLGVYKGHYQNFIRCWWMRLGKTDSWVGENSAVLFQIFFLFSEINLLFEGLFEGSLVYWNLEQQRKQGKKSTNSKNNRNIPFDIFLDIRMPHLYCNCPPIKLRLINLTNWPWCNGLWIKFLKKVLGRFTINPQKYFLCIWVWMNRSILPKSWKSSC